MVQQEPESVTTPRADDDAPCFEAIGRLVVEFARAEAFVHHLANTVSGLRTEKGMAVFSGVRLPDLILAVRACMRLNNMDSNAFDDLDACLTQLGVIGKARHKLAHRFVVTSNAQISAHTSYTARSIGSAETEVFTLDDVAAMTEDCFCIKARIYRHTDGEGRRNTRGLEGRIFQSWRYKSPLSAGGAPRSRGR
jgi:hypothetical protein